MRIVDRCVSDSGGGESGREGVAGEDPVKGTNRVAGRMSSAHLVPPPLLLE